MSTLLIVQTLNGLQFGLMLFLVAAGLTLVFGVMDFINLAHGVQYMLGAYLMALFAGLTGSFGLGLLLLVGLGLRHEVEFPAGQLRREADVLAAPPDGLGKVVLVHHDIHAVGVFVDDDAHDFGRHERVDHELRRFLRPENDVHSLAREFLCDRLYP
jgi:hypothetical protein